MTIMVGLRNTVTYSHSLVFSRGGEAGVPMVAWLNHRTKESFPLIRSMHRNQRYKRSA